jgi:hypothetical protein
MQTQHASAVVDGLKRYQPSSGSSYPSGEHPAEKAFCAICGSVITDTPHPPARVWAYIQIGDYNPVRDVCSFRCAWKIFDKELSQLEEQCSAHSIESSDSEKA